MPNIRQEMQLRKYCKPTSTVHSNPYNNLRVGVQLLLLSNRTLAAQEETLVLAC
jgi:hypothetical protein